jgi:hypothetical protein
MSNYLPEYSLSDSTADVIIERGRYWANETTFSTYKLTSGYDSNHYFSFDVNRGPEDSGWTLFSTPGTWECKAGAKTPQGSNAIFMVAENGNVAITVDNGDLLLKARNIHIEAGHNASDNANGSVHIKGTEKVSIHAPTVDIEAKRMLRLISSGNGVLSVSNVMEMGMGMCKAFSNSSSNKAPVNGMSRNYTQ